MHNLFSIIVICMSNKKEGVFSIQTGGFDTDKDSKQVVYLFSHIKVERRENT